MKAMVGRVVMAVLALGLAVLLCEVALRACLPQAAYAFEQGMFAPSDDYGYYLSPQHTFRHRQPEYDYELRANSWGFRGSEPHTNAAHRVLVLGDSYGMGQGVADDEVLCEIAEQKMLSFGLDVDVLNASISGYSTVNHLAVLRKLARSYNPDLVIVLFYWNDVGRLLSYHVVDGRLVTDRRIKHAELRAWLNRHSHLYAGLKRVYYRHFKKRSLARASVQMHDASALDITCAQLREMHRICRARGATVEVVLLPLYGNQRGDSEFRALKSRFIDKLILSDVHVWDWAEVLPATGGEDLVYPLDLHWTPKGHVFFAQYLGEIMLETFSPRTAYAL